jgi:hypothetical protein
MSHDYEPDASEKRIRFGCGFIFGGLFGFIVVLREVYQMTGMAWTCIAGIAILCGCLALRYGDEFWESITKWWF